MTNCNNFITTILIPYHTLVLQNLTWRSDVSTYDSLSPLIIGRLYSADAAVFIPEIIKVKFLHHCTLCDEHRMQNKTKNIKGLKILGRNLWHQDYIILANFEPGFDSYTFLIYLVQLSMHNELWIKSNKPLRTCLRTNNLKINCCIVL